MKKLLLTVVGVICSLTMMADDVTFGLTQAIDLENKKLGAVSYTGTTNVTNSGVQNGTKVDSYKATGANRTVTINNVVYSSDSQWRKNENTSDYTDNQWTGYSLTVATGYKLNITGVHAMLAINDDTYTWKVSILDASDNVLYESKDKKTTKASTTDFTLDYASLPEATKAKLTGITGTIKVRVYMYQGGGTKYFAIPYLTVTGNVEQDSRPFYTVSTSVTPAKSGTLTPENGSVFVEGSNVTFTATPAVGYKFIKMNVNGSDYNTSTHTLNNITADATAVATFEALPKITYALGEGAGVVPAADYAEVGANVTLPSAQTQLIYKEGYTMTGWSDGANTYAIGAQARVTGDMTFTAVFEENQAALGDEAVTVDWNFKTSTGAPAGAFEGNIGYYAKKVTIDGQSVDVIMKINTVTGASGLKDDKGNDCRGKWNTTSADNRAQVNKGTIFTIPAIDGMVVTMTITNSTANADMFTFAGEQGTADTEAKTVSYTYNGSASTIDIIDQGKNTYPAGLSVAYPVAPTTATITLIDACTDGDFVYGTYSNSSAFIANEDIIVYEIMEIDGQIELEPYATYAVVPANTGVLVAALEGGDYEVELSNEAGESVLGDDNALRPTGNGITADEMAAADAGKEYFRLTMHNTTECGFWWGAENGAAFALGANKAYLVADPAATPAKGFRLGKNTTGIKTVNAEKVANAKFIENGRIVIVKDGAKYNVAGQVIK